MLKKCSRLFAVMLVLMLFTSIVPVQVGLAEGVPPVVDTDGGQLAVGGAPVEGLTIENVAGLSIVTDFSVFDDVQSLSVKPNVIYYGNCKAPYLQDCDQRYMAKNPWETPNSATVLILSEFPGNPGVKYVTTAWAFGLNSVATSAYYLYNPALGGMATSVRVYGYGLNSSGVKTLWWSDAVTWGIPAAWVTNGPNAYDDYGFITTAGNIGTLTGWLGLRWKAGVDTGLATVSSVFPGKMWLIDFPFDKKPVGVFDWFVSPWAQYKVHNDKAIWYAQEKLLWHRLDVAPGDWGPALWQDYLHATGPCWGRAGGACYPTAVGIHTDWTANLTVPGGAKNVSSATRITKTVFDQMLAWKAVSSSAGVTSAH